MVVIGIDIGTSGIRSVAIDNKGTELYSTKTLFSDGETSLPESWWRIVLKQLAETVRKIYPVTIERIAVDGTSGSLLVTGQSGSPLEPYKLHHTSTFDTVFTSNSRESAPVAQGRLADGP